MILNHGDDGYDDVYLKWRKMGGGPNKWGEVTKVGYVEDQPNGTLWAVQYPSGGEWPTFSTITEVPGDFSPELDSRNTGYSYTMATVQNSKGVRGTLPK